MKLIKIFTLSSLLIWSANSWSLDIDEKLTIRFLKVSNSKKTVLVNRGAEDGLVVGDHAKFFITSGIVARGMVEKVSPSRSIWSMYRIVAPEEVIDNKVLNLKIASPVKVTSDPTKSLKEESIPEGNDKISIPKEMEEEAPKASEAKSDKVSDADRKELEDLGIEKVEHTKSATKAEIVKNEMPVLMSEYGASKKWEFFGGLALTALTGTDDRNQAVNGSTSSSSSFSDLTLGLERYFGETNTLNNFSVFALLSRKSSETGSDAKTTSSWFEYGGGLNYHFLNSPNINNRLIGYGTAAFGMGSVSVKEKIYTSGTVRETPYEGSTMFFLFGVGGKYYINNSLGARVTLDYYSSSETYSMDDGSTAKRTLSGPRIQVGLAYRF